MNRPVHGPARPFLSPVCFPTVFGRKTGFTLVEVISVMVVMVLMLTVAIGAHLVWKRQNALDAVTAQVLAHLSLARQHAITQARMTTFTATNGALHDDWEGGILRLDSDLLVAEPNPDRGLFFASTSATTNDQDAVNAADPAPERALLGDATRMPRRLVWFDREAQTPSPAPLHITFRPDGSCWPEEDAILTFLQDIAPAARTNRLLRRSIRVHFLTGLARPIPEDEVPPP